MKKIIQQILANKKYRIIAISLIAMMVTGTVYACSLGLGLTHLGTTQKQEQKTENNETQKGVVEGTKTEQPPVENTEPVKTNPIEQYFILEGVKTSNGVNLTWKITGFNIDHGFKIVKSTAANPIYPGNDYKYLSDPNTRSFNWGIIDGKTYHFRVCTYNGAGACLVYSNDIAVTAPSKIVTPPPEGTVTSITLSALSPIVKWSVVGYSDKGFKVVWSKNPLPTYPTREGDKYHYLSDPAAYKDTLDAFSGAGIYYARVCEYLGGACGVYSNQVTIEFK